jgi:rhodanese-related sulfurtransferase
MLAIFAAAAVVGWAFNSMSPLGVRADNAPAPAVARPQSIAPGEIYDNQPRAVTLGSASSAGRPAPAASGRIYDNETVATRLESASVANVPRPPAGPHDITWLETKKLLAAGRIVLVDARDANYYETGHIPGAISFPTAQATPDALATFAAKYPKNTPLVVYCGSLRCPLSKHLIALLTGSFGYTDVRDMAGGFVEYRETEEPPPNGRPL